MHFVLSSLVQQESNPRAHEAFIKYSKGTFRNKYLIQAKRGKEGLTIKMTNEYVNDVVRAGLQRCTGKISVTGVIVATFDVRAEIDFPTTGMKQFMGIKQVTLNGEVASERLLALLEKQPRAFYALSFSFPGGSIKTKAKAPKSAKPSSGGEKEIAPDFCTLKTNDEQIIGELLFGVPVAKQLTIAHDLVITSIELPKGVSNPVQLREQAIRSGSLVRNVTVDEKKTTTTYPFRV
jgi:hypothetical protein